MPTLRTVIFRFLPVVLCAVTAAAAAAQQQPLLPGEQLAAQNLRPYWYVFVAYAIAILLVMVWAGSIAKRLADVESRLGE